MAARRLAISSLLCADDAVPQPPPPPNPPQAHPTSPAPPPVVDRRSSREHEYGAALSSARHPVHLRRHTPSPQSEEAPPPPGASWSASKHSLSSILSSADPTPSHAYDYFSPSAESSRPSPVRAPISDPLHHHSYSPSATHSLRPSSSRSAYSDTGSASYPRHSLLPPASHSPSLSPASAYSLPLQRQHASQSPVGSRPVSTSPVNYFHPPPTQSTHRSPQLLHYHSPRSPAVGHVTSIGTSPPLPYSNSPHVVQRPPRLPPFSSSHSPPIMSDAPAPRTNSAASLPSLLNPAPPPLRPNAGGLGGLEALMEAATQESRRLSGEIGVRTSITPRASLSPVASRSSAQPEPLPRPFQSPVSPRFVHPPTLAVDIPIAPYTTIEPPLKKRRGSGLSPHGLPVVIESHRPSPPSIARSPSPPELRSPVSNIRSELPPVLPAPTLPSTEPARKSPVIQTPTASKPRGLDALLNPEPLPPPAVIAARAEVSSPTNENAVTDPGGSQSMKGRKRERDRSVPKEQERKRSAAPKDNVGSSRSETSRQSSASKEKPSAVPKAKAIRQEQVKEKPAVKEERVTPKEKKRQEGGEKCKGDPKEKVKDAPREGTQHEAEKPGTRDEDPHEWLLEHYATPSPSEKEPLASPALEKPPLPHPLPKRPIDSKPAATSPSEERAPHVTRVDSKRAQSRTRTPTPVAMLEQELDGGRTSEPPSGSSKRAPSESGASLELDLVAAVTPDAGAPSNQDDLMDLDVDDELLSLIDDKPRESHKTKHVQRSSSKPPSKPSHPLPTKADVAPSPSPIDIQRASMPPPASTSVGSLKDAAQVSSAKAKAKGAGGASVASHHKKKDGTAEKPIPKPKPAPKPRATAPSGAAKPSQKAKSKPSGSKETASSARSPAPHQALTPSGHVPAAKSKKSTPAVAPSAVKRSVSAAAGTSRSRSASVMPRGSAGPDAKAQGEEEAENSDEDEEDDKLYCVCKTPYDEDRVMIACDRCDEWYHTHCVDMPDMEVDLVDQFICPPCVKSNPHLRLRTTYKPRCLYGMKHPDPSSADACHKPARGAFSKYCSDECGTAYMQSRINAWGGDRSRLWESVKDAKPREGVAVRVKKEEPADDALKLNGDIHAPLERSTHTIEVVKPTKSRNERDILRLNMQLDRIASRREELKKDMEVVVWRAKLVEYATARAESLDECGWDQRLCFGEEEYATYGASVLESYEIEDGKADSERMQVDGMPEEGEWWCKGKKKCDRHAGWQKLRLAEVTYEKEVLDSALTALTAQERDIRRQMEDVVDSKARTSSSVNGPPLQPLNGKASLPGSFQATKPRDDPKKGKKRKD